jgi:predicted dehydrogenase
VAAAWHRDDQLREFASTFGVEAVRDYDAVLSRDDIDIVQIAAPVAEIPDLTIRAARAGKHIILGKPMAMTVAQADAMVAAVQRPRGCASPSRGSCGSGPGRSRRASRRGEFGDVVLMHQASRWSIAEDWYRSGTPGWFVDPSQVPGGALIDEGIYWIDLFHWLAGSEVVEVEARTRNLVHPGLAVEDWGFATFTFENGIVATLEGAWTITAPRVTGPSPKQNAVVRLEIIGTRGEYCDQWFRSPGRAGARRLEPRAGCTSSNPRTRSPRARRSRSITSSSASRPGAPRQRASRRHAVVRGGDGVLRVGAARTARHARILTGCGSGRRVVVRADGLRFGVARGGRVLSRVHRLRLKA